MDDGSDAECECQHERTESVMKEVFLNGDLGKRIKSGGTKVWRAVAVLIQLILAPKKALGFTFTNATLCYL